MIQEKSLGQSKGSKRRRSVRRFEEEKSIMTAGKPHRTVKLTLQGSASFINAAARIDEQTHR
jgi:hypothetical protein